MKEIPLILTDLKKDIAFEIGYDKPKEIIDIFKELKEKGYKPRYPYAVIDRDRVSYIQEGMGTTITFRDEKTIDDFAKTIEGIITGKHAIQTLIVHKPGKVTQEPKKKATTLIDITNDNKWEKAYEILRPKYGLKEIEMYGFDK